MAGINWKAFLGPTSDTQGMAEEAAAEEYVNLEPDELARKGTNYDPGKERATGNEILEAARKRTTNVSDIDNDDLRLPMRDRVRGLRNTSAMVATMADVDPTELEYDDGEIVAVTRTEPVAARELNAFSKYVPMGTTIVPGIPVLLVGQDYQRERTLLSSTLGGVLVGKKADISVGEGFLLPPNVVIETKIQEEIYACIPAMTSPKDSQVSMWVERG